jgi:hypothetical protein
MQKRSRLSCVLPALALLVCGFCTRPVHAGIYNFLEPEEFVIHPDFLGRYRPVLFMLRSVGMPEVQADNPLRKRYLLEEALGGQREKLTIEQQISYSAVLLRRKKYADAVSFLVPLTRQHPEYFFFDCHLAMAYHRSGELQRAVDTLQPVFDRAWPEDWDKLPPEVREFVIQSGWNEALYKFYRDTEKLYLKMLRSRLSESRRSKGKEADFQTIDPLFADDKGPVRFVDAAGKFTPGELAPAERAKLPREAPDMMRQLLLWMPDDPRLYWQLGEFYATDFADSVGKSDAKTKQAHLLAARKIFNELVQDFNVRAADLQERRHTLNELKSLDEDNSLEDAERRLAEEAAKRKMQPLPIDPADAPFPWRPFGVGMVSGFAVCIFFFWQVREWRRRR